MVITFNDIKYSLDSDGCLLGITNTSVFRKDVIIPKVFPNGKEVKLIDTEHQCVGPFAKIIISDDISTVWEGAFAVADVKEVVWSASCPVIPERCFSCSRIQNLSNIEQVTTIGSAAFLHAKCLKHLDLSKTTVHSLEKSCFRGLSPKAIVPSYYVDDNSFMQAFN